MTYKQRDDLVASLRELADFVERKGLELPELDVSATAWPSDYDPTTWQTVEGRGRKIMRRVAKALAPCFKDYNGDYFSLARKFGVISLKITTSRNKVCERKVVGFKEIPERVLPAMTEEVVEWVCTDPILGDVE